MAGVTNYNIRLCAFVSFEMDLLILNKKVTFVKWNRLQLKQMQLNIIFYK